MSRCNLLTENQRAGIVRAGALFKISPSTFIVKYDALPYLVVECVILTEDLGRLRLEYVVVLTISNILGLVGEGRKRLTKLSRAIRQCENSSGALFPTTYSALLRQQNRFKNRFEEWTLDSPYIFILIGEAK